MAKYDEKFKLSVVQSYETGKQGYRSVAQQYGLGRVTVQQWVAAYRQHGLSGLRKKFSHYSVQFKLSVLRRMQQEELSATQAVALFGIRGGAGVVMNWQRRYHDQGLDGLQPKPRGRPKKMTAPKSPKSTDVVPADTRSREELMEEVQYLRAEVAYLKKLRALLQSKEQAAQKKRR